MVDIQRVCSSMYRIYICNKISTRLFLCFILLWLYHQPPILLSICPNRSLHIHNKTQQNYTYAHNSRELLCVAANRRHIKHIGINTTGNWLILITITSIIPWDHSVRLRCLNSTCTGSPINTTHHTRVPVLKWMDVFNGLRCRGVWIQQRSPLKIRPFWGPFWYEDPSFQA